MQALFDPRSDDELRRIAEGIANGEIFTDRDLEFPELEAALVFLPIALMPAQIADALMAAKPGLIFAPMHRALPNTPKGLPPQFLCADYLSQSDAAKVMALVDQIRTGNHLVRGTGLHHSLILYKPGWASRRGSPFCTKVGQDNTLPIRHSAQ